MPQATSPLPPLINFKPPLQSWADYVASLPPGTTPRAQDIFDRWDAPKFTCPARPRNGSAAQRAGHTEEGHSPGKCSCGQALQQAGLRGLGERRAYLAWLAGMMPLAEADLFWMAVVSSRPEQLNQFAIVPTVRRMLTWLRDMEGAGE